MAWGQTFGFEKMSVITIFSLTKQVTFSDPKVLTYFFHNNKTLILNISFSPRSPKWHKFCTIFILSEKIKITKKEMWHIVKKLKM